MPRGEKCPVCGEELVHCELVDPERNLFRLDCVLCGGFRVAQLGHPALEARPATPEAGRHRLISFLRHRSESGAEPLELSWSQITNPESLSLPQDPSVPEKVARVFRFVAERSRKLGQRVQVKANDWPLVGAHDLDEFKRMLANLKRRGDIDWVFAVTTGEAHAQTSFGEAKLTLQGFDKYDAQMHAQPDGRRVFVAMSFAKEMKPAREGIRAAIESDCGLQALFADEHEHNDKIDDWIVAEIRRANLLVADFTGHRGGVYFEAGLAMGRGIPVVWCCREDELGTAHFDTRQYHHITWKEPDELRRKLVNRIRATFPLAAGAGSV